MLGVGGGGRGRGGPQPVCSVSGGSVQHRLGLSRQDPVLTLCLGSFGPHRPAQKQRLEQPRGVGLGRGERGPRSLCRATAGTVVCSRLRWEGLACIAGGGNLCPGAMGLADTHPPRATGGVGSVFTGPATTLGREGSRHSLPEGTAPAPGDSRTPGESHMPRVRDGDAHRVSQGPSGREGLEEQTHLPSVL